MGEIKMVNFTLAVAETEIENLKEQVSETKKSFEKAISKIDGLEQDITKSNILLAKLDMTQMETLKAVNLIIENGGTNRCVERGITLKHIENKIKELSANQCSNCKHAEEIRIIKNKQSSLRGILKWMLGIFTTVTCGFFVWYFTTGQHIQNAITK